MITDLLSGRAISTYPLSIGTSLAMEAITPGKLPAYDEQFKPAGKVNLSDYTTVWINLSTLHRNIVGAVDARSAGELKPSDVATVLDQEVDTIRGIISGINPGMRVKFYICGYRYIHRDYTYAKLREDKTPKQLQAKGLVEKTLSLFFQAHKDTLVTINETVELDEWGELSVKPGEAVSKNKSEDNYYHYNTTMRYSKGLKVKDRHLLLSHYALDLLCLSDIVDVDLLESHTGMVKGKALHYTKLLEGKDQPNLPFNNMTIQIYGDSQTFRPYDKSVREAVSGIAKKYKWHAATTNARMRLNLDSMQDKYTAEILKAML